MSLDPEVYQRLRDLDDRLRRVEQQLGLREREQQMTTTLVRTFTEDDIGTTWRLGPGGACVKVDR